MEWTSFVLGAVGALTGIGGLIVAWLGWRRSGEALRESWRAPVREEQHALLPRLADSSAELENLLEERINTDVQVATESETLKSDAADLRRLVDQLTAPVVVDAELDGDLQRLKSVVEPSGALGGGLQGALDRFIDLTERLAAARSQAAAGSADPERLISLGAEHGQSVEPLRRRNEAALEIVRRVRQRVRVLTREGLGSFPAAAPAVRKGRQQSPD